MDHGVSPLGGACPRFAGLLMLNIGLDLKLATILENVRICSHADPRNITNITMLCLLPVLRYCYWSWEWYVFNSTFQQRISSHQIIGMDSNSVRWTQTTENHKFLPLLSLLEDFRSPPLACWAKNLIGTKLSRDACPPSSGADVSRKQNRSDRSEM